MIGNKTKEGLLFRSPLGSEQDMAAENHNSKRSNEGHRVFSLVLSELIRMNISSSTARSYAQFAEDAYNYIKGNRDLQNALSTYAVYKGLNEVREGVGRIRTGTRMLKRAQALNLSRATGDFRDFRAVGFASVFSVSLETFEFIAKKNGIELNECALAISKTSLDIASAGVGAVTIESGLGAVLLLSSIYSTATDSYTVGTACFDLTR